MNKGQLKSRTRQLAGAELDGLREFDEIGLLVDEAYRQVGRLEDWRWLQETAELETADGKKDYALPETIESLQGIQLIDDPAGGGLPVPLQPVSRHDILTRVDRDREDRPRVYALMNADTFRVAATPDGVFTMELYGLKPLKDLAEDSDEPEFSSEFHPVIAYMAAATILDEEGQHELAEARRSKAEEFLRLMVEHYQTSKDKTPIIVGGGDRGAPVGRRGRLWSWRV